MSTKRLTLFLLVAIIGLVAYALLHTTPWIPIAAPPAMLVEPTGSQVRVQPPAGNGDVWDAAQDERLLPAPHARGGLTRGSSKPGEAKYESAKEHLRLERWDDAIEALEQALVAAPEHAHALNDLAFATLKRGRPADLERALAAAQRAAELEPSLWEAHYNLACVRARRNETDAALESLARALGLSPEEAAKTARDDPDLETLRKEARFEELIPAR